MKNNFSKYLSCFLTQYLPDTLGASSNTIISYCDTFRLFLFYCQNVKGYQIDKMNVLNITQELVISFLDWLEQERNCSISTRNQRLAAICSFGRYLQTQVPEIVWEIQKIFSIPYKKKPETEIQYITFQDIKNILSCPNPNNAQGRRDRMILYLLYDTGARVNELINIRVQDVRLDAPAKIRLTGKGMKQRSVPLLDETVGYLNAYMLEQGLMNADKQMEYLFVNHQKEKFTRMGISYILKKYADAARNVSGTVPSKVTPHILRHSKAMHLLQAGVNIVYIKDILGHSDITTTQIYVKADMTMKKEALEKAKIGLSKTNAAPSWVTDENLMTWLLDFGKTIK